MGTGMLGQRRCTGYQEWRKEVGVSNELCEEIPGCECLSWE